MTLPPLPKPVASRQRGQPGVHGSLITGPWDMTAVDGDREAVPFVTNVLNGTVAANGGIVNQGTVVRLNLAVSEKQMPVLESVTIVGTGFAERTDPAALVIGPTGLALSPSCKQSGNNCWTPFGEDEPVLYLADSLNNRIAVITDPLTRMSFYARAKRPSRTSFRPSTSNWYFLNRIPITSW